jgi:hypothetical protein
MFGYALVLTADAVFLRDVYMLSLRTGFHFGGRRVFSHRHGDGAGRENGKGQAEQQMEFHEGVLLDRAFNWVRGQYYPQSVDAKLQKINGNNR